MKKVFIAILCIGSLTSCYTARVHCGNITENDITTTVKTKKNHFLIAGLIPIGSEYKSSDFLKDQQNYTVETQQTFVDGLVSFITCGIYTPTTTKWKAPLK